MKKRLSDGSFKEYTYDRSVRKTLQFNFNSEGEKLVFEDKINQVSRLIFSKKKSLNIELMNTLLDTFIKQANGHEQDNESTSKQEDNVQCKCSMPLPDNTSNDTLFVCEPEKLKDFIFRLQHHAERCTHKLEVTSEQRCGFVCKYLLNCCNGHILLFETSCKVDENYTGNMRLILASLCSGMLNVQFNKFCTFSKMGTMSEYEKEKLFNTLHPVIADMAEQSIQEAINEEFRRTPFILTT